MFELLRFNNSDGHSWFHVTVTLRASTHLKFKEKPD